MKIRIALKEDAEKLLEIYAPYVLNTAITFEYEIPSVEEFAGRIIHTEGKYPYLVAEEEGKLLGYAYVSPFKRRAAYDWAVETSIYVSKDAKRKGIGSKLYEALEDALKLQGIKNLNACIAYPVVEDEHLNYDSVRFHEKLGYDTVAHFHLCGYKFNTWYDMIWMEKPFGEHESNPLPIKKFHEVQSVWEQHWK